MATNHFFAGLLLAPMWLLASVGAQSFTTHFEGAEDPLSEGGAWANHGADWTQIRKANGLAFGTQTGTNTGIYKYNDSYAHLSGFPPDQEALGQVHIAKPNQACTQELEILLRWSSSPHRTTGYECFARCVSSASSYVQIVRWDGPLGKFTYLADLRGTNYGLKDGDILKASIIGNRISVYINGVEKAHATDDSFKTGDPGIGEFLDCESGRGFGSNPEFGFSSFTAQGMRTDSPDQTAGPAGQSRTSGLECYATSDLERVFEDGHRSSPPTQSGLNLFGLRDETISGQCVLLAHENLEEVAISVSPLRMAQGNQVIAGQNVEWNFVEGIFVEKNSPNRQKESLVRSAPAWFPDYLSDHRHCSIRKGEQKAVYLTIRVPADAAPGEYRATVTAQGVSATASLPLIVQVYPLALPAQRHLFVTEWFSTSEFQRHHQLNPEDTTQFYRLLKIYADNMAAHRQNVFRLNLDSIQFRRAGDGKLDFDFSRFDRMAQVFWDTGQMDLLETGFIAEFGKGGWSSSEILLREFPVINATGGRESVPGKQFLPEFLPAFVKHLRAKGWLAKTVFHICDEPSAHNVMDWREASEFLHGVAPELRRIDAIETPHCLGALEVWVPKLDHLATWQSDYEQARRKGAELWFYTVGIYQGGSLLNKTVDVPLIETRLMHWLNYHYDLRGYLHWGFNAWTEDPIKAPGLHRGDGWHVYPKKDGLLNSLRWEQMRNGLQDYECLWLLENKIAEIRSNLPPRIAALVDPRQRSLEICAQVVADYYQHTQDPEVLYRARRQAIEETLALDQSPRVVLQTAPLEHSIVAKGCVVDIHGWAEPGTALSVAGEAIPVAPDGLFLAELSPSSDGTILIVAKRSSVKKQIARQFRR